MLKHRTPFHDLGGEEYERRAREREIKNLQKRAELGLAVVETPATPALAGSFRQGSQPRSNPIHAVQIASSGCGPPRNDIFIGRGVAPGM